MLIWGSIAASVLSALLMTVFPGVEAPLEVWLGLAGPGVVTGAEWIATERTFRRRPEGLTSLRIRLFAAKMVFFAGYVTVILGVGPARPVTFVVSFASYFLVLHVAEAIALHRLLTGRPR